MEAFLYFNASCNKIMTNFPKISFVFHQILQYVAFIQPACFGAGCYIEMATSYHQPHEYELVGG